MNLRPSSRCEGGIGKADKGGEILSGAEVSARVDAAVVETEYREYAGKHPEFMDDMILSRPFPFELFEVYRNWCPSPTKLLLLAESPPRENYPVNYFYNASYRGNLSNAVFGLFHIGGASKADQLMDFKLNRGYILVDTVKCAFDTRSRHIPRSLVKFSGEKLVRNEIIDLMPTCILVLGITALIGLKSFAPFNTCLADIDSVFRGRGEPVISRTCGDIHAVISPFPNDKWNLRYWSQIEDAFREAARIAEKRP